MARQAEECTNCSGVAIFDDKFRLLYSTPGLKPDETALKKYKDELLQGKKQYDIVSEGKSDSLIYAACPIYRSDGTLQEAYCQRCSIRPIIEGCKGTEGFKRDDGAGNADCTDFLSGI